MRGRWPVTWHIDIREEMRDIYKKTQRPVQTQICRKNTCPSTFLWFGLTGVVKTAQLSLLRAKLRPCFYNRWHTSWHWFPVKAKVNVSTWRWPCDFKRIGSGSAQNCSTDGREGVFTKSAPRRYITLSRPSEWFRCGIFTQRHQSTITDVHRYAATILVGRPDNTWVVSSGTKGPTPARINHAAFIRRTQCRGTPRCRRL